MSGVVIHAQFAPGSVPKATEKQANMVDPGILSRGAIHEGNTGNGILDDFDADKDGKLSREEARKFANKVFDFEVTGSEYADDTAVFFNSREELVRWTPIYIKNRPAYTWVSTRRAALSSISQYKSPGSIR